METNATSKFVKSLKDRKVVSIANYNFRSGSNQFHNFETEEFKDRLESFTILTVLDRFFYTDFAGTTHVSNVVVDRNEPISFYADKKKTTVMGREEFSFGELNELTFGNKQFNRKIILVGLQDGKLTKIEAQATSEKPVMNYLEKSGEDITADIDSETRQYKAHTSGILRLTKSANQPRFASEELEKLFQRLDNHINAINRAQLSGGKVDDEEFVPDFDPTNAEDALS